MNERDLDKPAEQQGLFRKFEVKRVDGSDAPGGKHENCRYFVLDLNHDPHAKAALIAYAESCAKTHPELAADLRQEFGLIESSITLTRQEKDARLFKKLLSYQYWHRIELVRQDNVREAIDRAPNKYRDRSLLTYT